MEENHNHEAGLFAQETQHHLTSLAAEDTNTGRAHSSDAAGAAATTATATTSPITERRRQNQAHFAFAANTEVQASTPRGTIWQVGNGNPMPLHPPQPAQSPSLALGSINTANLSPCEAARQHMQQWERIHAYHRVHNPSALALVTQHLAAAQRVYDQLCESTRPEDVLPRNQLPAFQTACIQARTALLRNTLADVAEGGEPMKANIEAALRGYDEGAIGFGETYTLIYAGHIVDSSCITWAEFTQDRAARLDRYAAELGPGYLWWEPPLARGGGGRMRAKKSTVLGLERQDLDELTSQPYGDSDSLQFVDDAAHYKVSLGFKRDDSLRMRLGVQPMRRASVVAKETIVEPAALGKRKRFSEDFGEEKDDDRPRVMKKTQETFSSEPQETGSPTIFFNMLLDSGAELPLLLHDDFFLLGFTNHDMNAASVVEIIGAAGQMSSALCFDLLGGLELGTGHSSYSEKRFFPTRVVKLPPSIKAPPHGGFSGERLSGMLPFLGYYLASAPGNEQLCFGEHRLDVLGLQNMPAGLKYNPFQRKIEGRMGQVCQALDGGEGLVLQSTAFESQAKNGKWLVDCDVVAENTGGIESSIEVLEQDGTVIGQWRV